MKTKIVLLLLVLSAVIYGQTDSTKNSLIYYGTIYTATTPDTIQVFLIVTVEYPSYQRYYSNKVSNRKSYIKLLELIEGYKVETINKPTKYLDLDKKPLKRDVLMHFSPFNN